MVLRCHRMTSVVSRLVSQCRCGRSLRGPPTVSVQAQRLKLDNGVLQRYIVFGMGSETEARIINTDAKSNINYIRNSFSSRQKFKR